MGDFSTYFPLPSSGGGGGATNQTILNVGGVEYPILSGDIQDNFDAYVSGIETRRPQSSTSAYNQPSLPGYKITRPSHPSITSGTLASSTSNYTSVFNDTSGGGIFWWAYGYIRSRVGSTATTTRTQLDMRVTIDGGTPFILSTPTSIITSSTSASTNSYVASNIALGLPLFSEYRYGNDNNGYAGINRYPTIPSLSSSTKGIFLNAIDGATSFIGRGSGSNGSTYGSALNFSFYDADVSRRYNVPGLKYETSLNIEFETYYTLPNQTSRGYACCVTQF